MNGKCFSETRSATGREYKEIRNVDIFDFCVCFISLVLSLCVLSDVPEEFEFESGT